MSESANGLALAAFETWDGAVRALVGFGRAGIGSARVIFIALSSVFKAGAYERTFELPFSEAGERVRCNSRYLSRQFGSEALGQVRFEEALRAWLAPRQAVRIADYVRQRKIVIAVRLRKPGDERSVGLVLLRSSSTPVEFHDLRPGGAASN